MVALWMVGGWGAAHAQATGPGGAALDDQVSVAGEAHDTPRVTTQGAGVPLRAALRRMVPVTYSINLPNAGAWAATPVSWSAGHSLAQTLREMLAGHPELAAQVDTDFQLVTVRYRQPFGSDTVGALMPPPVPPMPSATLPGGVADGGPASGVVVGGPIGGAAPASPMPDRASAAGKTGASRPATQADRTPDTELPLPGARGAAADRHPVAGALPAGAGPLPLPARTWRIELSDRTVRGALTRWTQEAGWRLIWEAPVDFAVDAPATLTGTFDEALQSVIGALSATDAPVQAILYRGNKVLRIVEKGAG
ncbi:toxin co-regulated pilus biosynthesis Q family protein [Burkholderia pyrrocinia]